MTAEVTVFQPSSSSPNTNTLASAWSPTAFSRAAAMAGLEARGRHNSAVHYGHRLANQVSLSLFAPEMNVVRAPLWGRAQEACGGEDPLLTARNSAAFVRGLQVGVVGEGEISVRNSWALLPMPPTPPTMGAGR